jgi:quinohemoprotein ethanol dehydrogenase
MGLQPERRARVGFVFAGLLSVSLLLGGVALSQEPVPPRPVDDARIHAADQEPGSWLAHGRTWNEQRHSPLRQIDVGNVGRLGLAWSYETGTRRGMEATPLIADGVLYATGSWSVVYALDARNGREIWRFDPKVPRARGRDACCDVVNRGVALWKGRVYVGTIDGRLIALDARTGRPVWQVQTTDPTQPYTITGAPRVLKDKVIIGNGGADLGVRGYVSAYSTDDGELSWRFFTVPASHAGPHEHPELEAAARTWPTNALWETGLGGTAWDSFAYDPELDLLYVGVGNSSVYDREKRSPGGGDNLYLASILALRPDTGRLVWHYQTTPGEHWDYTATQHMILAEIEFSGVQRKVLMQAPKNGFFYVLDRATGELLSARPFVEVSWASRVDLMTGRPVERPEASWSGGSAFVTPGAMGGHNWHPMSYSPSTGLVYIPSLSSTYPYRADPNFTYKPGSWNTAEDLGSVLEEMEDIGDAIPFCAPSHITAWDPIAGRRTWRVEHENAVPGGILSTAGGLVFQGTGAGNFSAYDAQSGTLLWDAEVGIGIMAPPVSYAIDGEQYVAVVAGIGGSHGGHFTRFEYINEGRVLAFKLGGHAPIPAVRARPTPNPDPPRLRASVEEVSRGRHLYARHCLFCHGMGAKSSGLHPDLRESSRAVHDGWNDIVLGGVRQQGGMASFADALSIEDSNAIHAYVITRALHEPGLVERSLRWLGQYACIPAEWMAD